MFRDRICPSASVRTRRVGSFSSGVDHREAREFAAAGDEAACGLQPAAVSWNCATWPAFSSTCLPVKRVRMRRSWVTTTTAPW